MYKPYADYSGFYDDGYDDFVAGKDPNMTKKRSNRGKKAETLERKVFKYCSACGSRQKINGTCRACGVTDAGKGKKPVAENSDSNDTTSK